MKPILVIIFLILLTIISCKDDETTYNHNRITNSDLINCFYKTNSYWVYKDSVTNINDSIFVIDYNHDTQTYADSDASWEIFYFRTNSSSTLETTDYIVNCIGLFKDYTIGEMSGQIIYFGGRNEHLDSTSQMLDSIFIYNQYYYDVLKVEVLDDKTEDNYNSLYFTNSKYGILKHEIYDDTILISQKILMRKNIVR